MNESDPKSLLFQDCHTSAEASSAGTRTESSSVSQSLMEEMWVAEKDLRGSRAILQRDRGKKGRIFDFIWLIYSVFFFLEPIGRHNRRTWLEFAAAYSIFLAIYCGMVFVRSRRTQWLLLIALFLLAIGYVPLNQGAAGMFIYVTAFVPFLLESLPLCVASFIGVAAIMMTEGILLHLNPWTWGLCAFFAIGVGTGNLMAAQRMRANQKLHLAHEQIAHLAKVAERERIARDLHDVLGHTLSVVVLKTELAGKLMDRDPARARREIAEVEQIARQSLMEVRQAIRGYRTEGLAAEIERAQKTLDAAGVTLECGTNPPPLAAAQETVLSLIVREAVTNIVRHAQASRCRLEFEANGNGTALVVEDDGRGGIQQEGNGLRGMRERVESLGGHLRIDSGQGTRLVIEIPPQTVNPA